MRYLLVSHHAPPHIGGVENLVLAEAKALIAAGHEVVWLTSAANGAGEVPAPQPNLRFVRIAAWHVIERHFRIAYPLFAPSLIWRTWREVGRADVVHAHGLVFLASPFAMLFGRLRGKWTICTDHAGLLRYRWSVVTFGLRVLFATLGRITALAAHRLIAYNADIEKLMRRLVFGAAKVAFVANPVDAARWRPPTKAQRAAARAVLGWDEKPRVLCVARLLPHKGVDVLLAAQDPAWQVVFCGPGEDTMREHIRSGGANCLPARPQGELLTLYHAADVFVLPSYNEGFPVAIQEALACGLPVLTSDSPAYAPYRGTPGLHFCAPTPDAVREHLRRLLAADRAQIAPLREVDADPAATGARAAQLWLRDVIGPMDPSLLRRSGVALVLGVLVLAQLLVGLLRLPGKVWQRRVADVAAYREQGPAEFLLQSAKLEGGADLTWLLQHAPADSVVLWRWPCDGAVEFAPALLAPRWCVDERAVAPEATEYRGRPLARGSLPNGEQGVFVVEGTPAEGLVLRVRRP